MLPAWTHVDPPTGLVQIVTTSPGTATPVNGCVVFQWTLRGPEAVGGNDLPHLKQVVERWKAGGALELTVLREDDETFEFDVTRCRFAEMYHRLGLADLGPLLSCNRDGAMIEGFNPALDFRRTQTIMEGAHHCDFRYRRPG